VQGAPRPPPETQHQPPAQPQRVQDPGPVPSDTPEKPEEKEDTQPEISIILEIDDIVSEDNEEQQGKKIGSTLKKLKKVVIARSEKGYDVTELEEMYRQCGNVFASDDMYTATHYLESIQTILEKMLQADQKVKVTGKDAPPDRGSEILAEDRFGGEVEDDLGSSAEGSVTVEDRTKTELVEDWEMEDEPEMGDKEKAIQALESAKRAITDADGDGFDISGAKRMFQKARPLYETGTFSDVIEIATEVEREVMRAKGLSEHEIKEIIGDMSRERAGIKAEPEDIDEGKGLSNEERRELIGMINKVWIPLREATRYGLDISGFEDLLEQAKSKRSFHQARVLVESVETEVKNKLDSYKNEQHDKASNMFHYIRSEILSAGKSGLDISQYQLMQDRASRSISLGDYEDAIGTMERCLTELKTAEQTAQGQVQETAAEDASSRKSDLVWDADDEEEEGTMPEPEGAAKVDEKDELTDEKRLKILEDRFILGEISEDSYRDLKNSILDRMKKRD
jgi:hypothetical protein